MRIPLRLDRALALGSASDGPWRLGTDRFSSERSVCSTALQEGLSDLYDPDDYSKISYDDLRSDIIMVGILLGGALLYPHYELRSMPF